MTNLSRPSLDTLIPLMMIENRLSDDTNENSSDEPQKEIIRNFESGDLVLIRVDGNFQAAIVFNATGLVMKFDIDRQLYHVCLLNKELTDQWVDAADMIIYAVPMIAESDDEQTSLMWSTANELLEITNRDDAKTRLEEFQRRYYDTRQEQRHLSSSVVVSKSETESTSSRRPRTSQGISLTLTTCEEYVIIDAIHRLSHCSYNEAKHVGEEVFLEIINANNRENMQWQPTEAVVENWFIKFITQHIEHFQRYSIAWLSDLEAMSTSIANNTDISSLISLMKRSI